MIYYVIGLPKVNKSEIAKKLSEKLNFEFIDLTPTIELDALMFISDMIYSYGEITLNAQIKKALKSIKDNTIVAVTSFSYLEKSDFNGTVLYLEQKEYDSSEIPLLSDNLANKRSILYDGLCDYKFSYDTNVDEIIAKII